MPGLPENVVGIKKGCVTPLVCIYPATNLRSPCFFGVVVLKGVKRVEQQVDKSRPVLWTEASPPLRQLGDQVAHGAH